MLSGWPGEIPGWVITFCLLEIPSCFFSRRNYCWLVLLERGRNHGPLQKRQRKEKLLQGEHKACQQSPSPVCFLSGVVFHSPALKLLHKDVQAFRVQLQWTQEATLPLSGCSQPSSLVFNCSPNPAFIWEFISYIQKASGLIKVLEIQAIEAIVYLCSCKSCVQLDFFSLGSLSSFSPFLFLSLENACLCVPLFPLKFTVRHV